MDIYTHNDKCPCPDCWAKRYAAMWDAPVASVAVEPTHCVNHRRDIAGGDCIRCGKTDAQITIEREEKAARRSKTRPVLSDAERYAQDVDRRILNESRCAQYACNKGFVGW